VEELVIIDMGEFTLGLPVMLLDDGEGGETPEFDSLGPAAGSPAGCMVSCAGRTA